MNSTTQSKELEPAAPRPAATVILLRDSPRGAEALMTLRPKNLAFMGGATVFPGGAVDDGDLDPSWEEASAVSRLEAAEALGMTDPGEALAAYVCAVREAFEEVGWLPGAGGQDRIQRADAATGTEFRRVCGEAGIVLATDRLVFAGRWITPLGAPRRFDTRFFATRVEPSWEPSPAPGEVESCMWVTPGEALARLGAGELLMAPPTIEMLQRLQPYRAVEEMLAAIADSASQPQKTIISTPLSPLVRVVLAPNPGLLTGPGTNSYVVGTGPKSVIDPAVDDPEYLDALLESGAHIDTILITHRHPDHVGGVSALVARTGATVRAFGTEDAGGVPVEPIVDGEELEVGGATLTSIYSPGHARDHICLYLRSEASLFAGDNILGEGTAVIAPPEGDMRAYLDSLRTLSKLHVRRIYPGHFRPLNEGNDVIGRYISHRAERERQIFEVLEDEPTSIEGIVDRVYADVPAALHPIARYSVLAHLEMAEADGRILRVGRLWKLRPKS